MDITRQTITDRINKLRSVGLEVKEIQLTFKDALEFMSLGNGIHMDQPRMTRFHGVLLKLNNRIPKSRIILKTIPLHDDA